MGTLVGTRSVRACVGSKGSAVARRNLSTGCLRDRIDAAESVAGGRSWCSSSSQLQHVATLPEPRLQTPPGQGLPFGAFEGRTRDGTCRFRPCTGCRRYNSPHFGAVAAAVVLLVAGDASDPRIAAIFALSNRSSAQNRSAPGPAPAKVFRFETGVLTQRPAEGWLQRLSRCSREVVTIGRQAASERGAARRTVCKCATAGAPERRAAPRRRTGALTLSPLQAETNDKQQRPRREGRRALADRNAVV